MKIEELLKNRTEKLVWAEPYPGIDSSGNERTCVCELCMSVQDAIDHSRKIWAEARSLGEAVVVSDEDLLVDFMTVHWADHKDNLPPSHSVDKG